MKDERTEEMLHRQVVREKPNGLLFPEVTLHHQSHIVRFIPQRNPCEFSVPSLCRTPRGQPCIDYPLVKGDWSQYSFQFLFHEWAQPISFC